MQVHNINVLSGQTQRLDSGLHSAINKHPIQQATELLESGLACDQQADKKHHGGAERALHLYPLEHYPIWQAQYPNQTCFQAGAFGENLSTLGATESQVCIGDVFQLGDAVVQISQPRSPCFKLNQRFGVSNLALQMQLNGLSGYLLRVLQPGKLMPQTKMTLLSRESPELTVQKVAWQFFNNPLDHAFLARLLDCAALSESWQIKAQQRLSTGMVEDWNKRLFGFSQVQPTA